MPSCGDTCNSAWALTDYTPDNGPIAMVPGSHKYCRQPRLGEGEDMAVPVEAPEGSLIVWHGNTWHGAYPKKTDGLRLVSPGGRWACAAEVSGLVPVITC